ncbi:TonB-dependent receptor [Acetobacter musti]|uniref:TonB-dependent receptor n=1 Tax=Acetobacter musti TaxID=864732 RepID=A0ABX0JWM4_9PROT|nr:TonB-dependent receptor [Acetobacter musti]NHN86890.1 TonB-dependent receptor [Acetobacter musti]
MLNRTCFSILLTSTALASCFDVAQAATRKHHAPVRQATASAAPQKAAVTASAPPARPAPTHMEAKGEETVAVTGRSARTRTPGGGLLRRETATKAIQTVSHEFIAKQSPTTNIQQLMAMMPSANVSNQDPYGIYSGQMTVRGMDQTQIGWLLDGMPLNDIGGGQFYANEVLEAEDLESVSLQPGSVNLDSPTVNASGGLTSATMSDPTHKAGGLIDVSFGSFDTHRQFLRLNSGDIGNSGVRAMFAFSHTDGNTWRGPGQFEKFHYDFKMVKDFDNGSHTGLTVSYNHQINDSMLNPNLTQYRATGYSTNYAASWINQANGKANSANTNYYKLHVNPFQNVIAVLPSHIVLTPKLSIDDSIYFWYGAGNGTGASSLTEGNTYMGNQPVAVDVNGDGKVTPGTSAIVLAPSNQQQFRPGNTIKLNFDPDKHHHIELGWWYEYSNLDQYSPLAYVNQTTGQPLNIWGTKDVLKTTDGQLYRARDFLTLTQVNMIFIGDTMKYFNDRLRVDVGFKEAMVTRRTYDYSPGTEYNRNLHSAEPLPQFGASWTFNKHHQVYVSAATNFRMPSNTSLVDYYSTSGAVTQKGGSTKPEYSISEELGYRYTGDWVSASVSFFNYNFTNRLVSQSYYDGAGGASYGTTINAGGQTTRGVDVQVAATRPLLGGLRPYATFEYLHSTIDNNIAATGNLNGQTINDYLPTKGKEAIRAPKVMAGLGLDYDTGRWFIAADLKYVGQQYATFMNDNKIPQYITNSINMGYRFPRWGFLKAPQIQLNMSNMTNAKFRNGVYSTANNANPVKGIYGSTISGSSPSYYLQPPFTAIVTVSTTF